MATANFEFSDFRKGLLTDVSPIVGSVAALKTLSNFNINKDGSVSKRGGVEFASQLVVDPWPSVNAPVQYNYMANGINDYGRFWGHTLRLSRGGSERFLFIHAAPDSTPNNNTLLYAVVFDMDGNALTSSPLIVGAASGGSAGVNNILPPKVAETVHGVVVSSAIPDLYLISESNSGTITSTTFKVRARDFDIVGGQDPSTYDDRPAALSIVHEYNLKNAGWSQADIDQVKTDLGVYPSIADMRQFAKVTDSASPELIGTFDPEQLDKNVFGQTPAPRGKFIVDVGVSSYRRVNYVSGSGDTALDESYDFAGYDCVGYMDGRVFYSLKTTANVAPTPNATSKFEDKSGIVYYSRLIKSVDDLGKCYQDADPTSEHISDLIATDGGFVKIEGLGRVYAMEELLGNMLVFAEGGIWSITGNGGAFSATSNSVVRLTSSKDIAEFSVVALDNVVAYIDKGDMWVVTLSDGGTLTTVNVTQGTMESVIETILSSDYRGHRYGDSVYYDYLRGAAPANTTNPINDSQLVFDSVLGAFYTIEYAHGFGAFGDRLAVLPMAVDNDGFIVNEGCLFATFTIGGSEFYDDVVTQMYLPTGTSDVSSYLGTSPVIATATTHNMNFNDTQRVKEPVYVTTHMKFTDGVFVDDGSGNPVPEDPSQCTLSGHFDNKSNGSTPREIYRPRYLAIGTIGDPVPFDEEVVTSKNKIRGRGNSLYLEFKSSEAKNAHLYGYAMAMTGTRDV